MIKRSLWFVLACAIAALLFFLFRPITPTIAQIQPRESTQYWSMVGGYEIAYTHLLPTGTAPPKAEPILFLHGGPGGYIHSSIIETLEPLTSLGYNVFLYDQSGTGLSERRTRPKDTSIASHLADLEEIRNQIGADQIILIGHSFGGLLAALYTADHPTRVAKLILSAPGEMEPILFDEEGNWANLEKYPDDGGYNFIDVSEHYLEDTSGANLPLRAMASFALAHFFNFKFASDAEVDAALNTMASRFTRNMVCSPENIHPEEGGGGAYMRITTNFFPDDFKDRRSAMATSDTPVLVLHGQCDFIPYASVYEYADLFPNSQYVFVEGAGHIIYWDEPVTYVEEISDFLIQGNKP